MVAINNKCFHQERKTFMSTPFYMFCHLINCLTTGAPPMSGAPAVDQMQGTDSSDGYYFFLKHAPQVNP